MSRITRALLVGHIHVYACMRSRACARIYARGRCTRSRRVLGHHIAVLYGGGEGGKGDREDNNINLGDARREECRRSAALI